MFHDRVGDQGQHDEQRQRAQGDQGEQRVKAEQHHQVEQAEAEVHQGGEGPADQEIAQAVELVEVVGDAAHGPGIEEALGKPNQPIENRFSGVHVHAVGHAGENQAAQSCGYGGHHAGADQDHADADHGIERITAAGAGVDQAHDPQRSHQGQHVHHTGADQHFDQFAAVGAQEGAVPGPTKALLFAVGPAAQQQDRQTVVLLRLDHIGVEREWSEFRVEQAQLAVLCNALQQGDVTLVDEHRRTGDAAELLDRQLHHRHGQVQAAEQLANVDQIELALTLQQGIDFIQQVVAVGRNAVERCEAFANGERNVPRATGPVEPQGPCIVLIPWRWAKLA